ALPISVGFGTRDLSVKDNDSHIGKHQRSELLSDDYASINSDIERAVFDFFCGKAEDGCNRHPEEVAQERRSQNIPDSCTHATEGKAEGAIFFTKETNGGAKRVGDACSWAFFIWRWDILLILTCKKSLLRFIFRFGWDRCVILGIRFEGRKREDNAGS